MKGEKSMFMKFREKSADVMRLLGTVVHCANLRMDGFTDKDTYEANMFGWKCLGITDERGVDPSIPNGYGGTVNYFSVRAWRLSAINLIVWVLRKTSFLRKIYWNWYNRTENENEPY